ncbi:DUF4893 domain-containing protein [Thalassococcus sp. S3]|uniref:DUF4893 domain-containing protein n=1 Tax=Thalassococcus sp. S3 TaxID=2017482 RepID=UPI0010245F65|nr:DUF4893 domain-containing protein [Thalassococcus sp. S3]QBF30747.1 DUF4893 domain-containing protein [Thalassococcus sp. S3]
MTFKTLCAALCLAASPLTANPDLRPPDQDRIKTEAVMFAHALRQALADGAPEDVAVLVEALSGGPGLIAPEGEWNCRTMKMAGFVPLAVYQPFECIVRETGTGEWNIRKITGSQRMRGTLTFGEVFTIYTGVGYAGGPPATDYAGLPEDSQEPVEPNQTHAQVGIFEQMSPNRARLLLPSPVLESSYDILYLTR